MYCRFLSTITAQGDADDSVADYCVSQGSFIHHPYICICIMHIYVYHIYIYLYMS